jgi:cytochrome c peroxidase
MKALKIAMFSAISLGLIFSLAIAAGNVEKGKALFNDAKLGGGTSGVSCNSCHPDGKGLEKAADRKDKDLEKQVNLCIKNAHILSATHLQLHRMTPFARWDGRYLVYPAEETSAQ